MNETETKSFKHVKKRRTRINYCNFEYDSRTRNFRNALANLLGAGLIEMTIPSKPRSKYQKYIISEKGIDLLKRIENNGSRRE